MIILLQILLTGAGHAPTNGLVYLLMAWIISSAGSRPWLISRVWPKESKCLLALLIYRMMKKSRKSSRPQRAQCCKSKRNRGQTTIKSSATAVGCLPKLIVVCPLLIIMRRWRSGLIRFDFLPNFGGTLDFGVAQVITGL